MNINQCEGLLLWFSLRFLCIVRFTERVDDNLHMNSLPLHRRVQLGLSFVQWNVYDEASLELDSVLLNNLDLNLNRRFLSSLIKVQKKKRSLTYCDMYGKSGSLYR